MKLPLERIRRQRLSDTDFTSPHEAVAWMGAMQAQDLPGACWSVAQRTRGCTVAEVMAALDAGELLRTHLLRPTWHLVAREDVRWMLEATAARVLTRCAPYFRQVGADVLRKRRSRMARVLRGRSLTRAELAEELDEKPTGDRLAWVLIDAELHGVLTSGPRSGKQQTYALLDERVPESRKVDADEALRRLTLAYFRARAPARLEDFEWWASLTRSTRSRAIDLAQLEPVVAAGDRGMWRVGRSALREQRAPSVSLLPPFDEYLIAYADRSDVLDPRLKSSAALPSYFVVNGVVAGTWRATRTAREVRVTVKGARTLGQPEQGSLEKAVGRYAAALQQPLGELLR